MQLQELLFKTVKCDCLISQPNWAREILILTETVVLLQRLTRLNSHWDSIGLLSKRLTKSARFTEGQQQKTKVTNRHARRHQQQCWKGYAESIQFFYQQHTQPVWEGKWEARGRQGRWTAQWVMAGAAGCLSGSAAGPRHRRRSRQQLGRGDGRSLRLPCRRTPWAASPPSARSCRIWGLSRLVSRALLCQQLHILNFSFLYQLSFFYEAATNVSVLLHRNKSIAWCQITQFLLFSALFWALRCITHAKTIAKLLLEVCAICWKLWVRK